MPRIEIENYKTNPVAGVSTLEVRPQDVGFNAGALLEQAGKVQMKVEERDAVAYTTSEFSKFQLEEMGALQAEKESGGADFTQRYLAGYDKRLQSYIDNAPSSIAATLLQERANQWKDNVAGRAIDFEVKAKSAERLAAINTAGDNYLMAVRQDPSTLKTAIQQYNGDVDAAAATGTLTPIQAEERKAQYQKKAGQNALYPQLESNDLAVREAALASLKSGEQDYLYVDNPKQKLTDIETTEKSINSIKEIAQNKATVNKILGQPINITTKLVNADISLQDINDLENSGEIEPLNAEVLRNALTRTDIDPKVGDISTRNRVYTDLVQRYGALVTTESVGTKEQISEMAKWTADVQNAIATGDITKAAMKDYVGNMDAYYKNTIDADAPTRTFLGIDFRKNPDFGIESLKVWADNTAGYENADNKALLYTEYARIRAERGLDKMPDGDAKQKAITKAINDVKAAFLVKRDPSLSAYETLPNSVMQGGKKVNVNPNFVDIPARESINPPAGTKYGPDGNPAIPIEGKPGTYLYNGKEVRLQ